MKLIGLFFTLALVTQSASAVTPPARSFGCQGMTNGEGVKVIVNQYRKGGLTDFFQIEIGSSRGTYNHRVTYVPNLDYVKRDTPDELLVKESRQDITVFMQMERVLTGNFPAQIIIKEGDYDFHASLTCEVQN